jgi:hypothetical protein
MTGTTTNPKKTAQKVNEYARLSCSIRILVVIISTVPPD